MTPVWIITVDSIPGKRGTDSQEYTYAIEHDKQKCDIFVSVYSVSIYIFLQRKAYLQKRLSVENQRFIQYNLSYYQFYP